MRKALYTLLFLAIILALLLVVILGSRARKETPAPSDIQEAQNINTQLPI